MKKPLILVYRRHILAPNETFIKAQTGNLKKFNYHYIGNTKEQNHNSGNLTLLGLDFPNEKTTSLGNSNIIKDEIVDSLKKLNPKLIHAHNGMEGTWIVPLAKQLNIPLIVTCHGTEATAKSEHLPPFYINNIDKVSEYASLFIAASKKIKYNMLEKGYPEHKIRVHYTGVDVNFFNYDISIKREPIVLFVARLVEIKGLNFLIEAMSIVQQRCPEAKLVVIGEGPLKKELEDLASKKIYNYEFIGLQSPEKVRYWLNRTKVLCVPSIVTETGATEGFGMVFVEANAMGVPVVSFNNGGIPEAVAHNKTGLLAEDKNFRELANYITLFLQDEATWSTFSNYGRERVCEMFNLEKQMSILENIYQNVIAVW